MGHGRRQRYFGRRTIIRMAASYGSATLAKSCTSRDGLDRVSDRSCTRTFTHVRRNVYSVRHLPGSNVPLKRRKFPKNDYRVVFAHWKCFTRGVFFTIFSRSKSVPFKRKFFGLTTDAYTYSIVGLSPRPMEFLPITNSSSQVFSASARILTKNTMNNFIHTHVIIIQ